MRQALAWELALRALHHEQEERALAHFQAAHASADVRDLEVSLRVHSRHVSLFYVPGYLISYQYGTHQQGSLTILAQSHQAMVSGCHHGPVVAERHFSPHKSQIGAAGAVIAAQGALLAATAGAVDPAALLTVDTAFAAFLAASAAGIAASGFTGFVRDRHTGNLEHKADNFNAQYMRDGLSAVNVESPHDQWLRSDIEWLRWEETDKWEWDRDKRAQWAERLFREQKIRKLRNEAAVRQMHAEAATREREAQREALRRKRFGTSQRQQVFTTGRRAGGVFDFKGYWKALGIQESEAADISGASIKDAYRRAAKRVHPDVTGNLSQDEQAQARKRFQKLQTAYETLKDPTKRKQYNAGSKVD